MDRTKDGELVNHFVQRTGRLVVCGGTTAQIVSRCLGAPFHMDPSTMTEEVPPIGEISGIDLVTEGMLTLTRVRDHLQSRYHDGEYIDSTDGAARLLRILMGVDQIHFLVGCAVNPVNKCPPCAGEVPVRLSVVREIAKELEKQGKEIIIESI